jgi:hypothetical protein
MTRKHPRKPRASIAERAAADQVLKSLFEKAYLEGNVVLEFGPERPQPEKEARGIFEELAGFRRRMSVKKVQQIALWSKMVEVELTMIGLYKVVLRRKRAMPNSRVHNVINLPDTMPQLGLSNGEPNATPSIADIIEGMKKAATEST